MANPRDSSLAMPPTFGATELHEMRKLAHDLSCQYASLSSAYKPLAKSLRTLRNTLEDAEDAFESFGDTPVWSVETRLVRATNESVAVLKRLEGLWKDTRSQSCSDIDSAHFLETVDSAAKDLADALAACNQASQSLDTTLDTSFHAAGASPSTYSPFTSKPYDPRSSESIVPHHVALQQTRSQEVHPSHGYDPSLHGEAHQPGLPMHSAFSHPDPLSIDIDTASYVILRNETLKQNRLHRSSDASGSAEPLTRYTALSRDRLQADPVATRTAATRTEPEISPETNSMLPNDGVRPRSATNVSTSALNGQEDGTNKFNGVHYPFKVRYSGIGGERTASFRDEDSQFGTVPPLLEHDRTQASEHQRRPLRPLSAYSSREVEPSFLVDTISAKLQENQATSFQTFDLQRDTQDTINSLRAMRRKGAARPTYRVVNPDVQPDGKAQYVPRQQVLQAPSETSSPSYEEQRNGADSPLKSQSGPCLVTQEHNLPDVLPPPEPEEPEVYLVDSKLDFNGIEPVDQDEPKMSLNDEFQSQLHVKAGTRSLPMRYRRRTFNGSKDAVSAFDSTTHTSKQFATIEHPNHLADEDTTHNAKGFSAPIRQPDLPTIILPEVSDTTKEACVVLPDFSDLEVVAGSDQENQLIRAWNDGLWPEAKKLLKHMLDDSHKTADRTIVRRLSHLLGVVASIQGEWHEALDNFLLALNSPLVEASAVDAGDCAAAYWLGDTYALLGRNSEALLAYCIAEHGPLFQGSEGYALHRCIRAEQAACQLGASRSQFKLQMDRKMSNREPTSFGSIFDPSIVTMPAARQFLESACWPPENHNLSQAQNRTAALWGQGVVPEESRILELHVSTFTPTAAWPIPFDPYFAIVNVASSSGSSQNGENLLILANSESAVKAIPKAPAFSRRGTDQFNCFDLPLTWFIKTVRECLTYLECEWSEIVPEVNPLRPGFSASYDTVESGVATKHFFFISLIRPTLRAGYAIEICPDGISSARIMRHEPKFDKGVHQDELKRFKKRMRKYLETARERQEAINMKGMAMPAVSMIGAKPWTFDQRASV